MAEQENFIIEEFTSYKVFIYGGDDPEVSKEVIHLNIPSGKAIIRFKDGPIGKNSYSDTGTKKVFEVRVATDRYMSYIDLLRNEKPLFFYYNLDDNHSYITTSDEPVGEGE